MELRVINCESNLQVPEENIPEYINDYFISIGKELNLNNAPCRESAISFVQTTVTELPDYEFQHIYPDELVKLAKTKINNSDTKDVFDISGTFLYQIVQPLSDHFTYLINNILKSDYYPNTLKMCRLTPLFKGKGDTTNVRNYRPITIVPTISKLIESIISKEIMGHLNTHQALSDCQYAYRIGRSTTAATHAFLDGVVKCLENKKKVAGIFIDLSKAFDSVDHQLLIDKLRIYGMRGKSEKLLKSFLQDRQQSVEVKINGKILRSNPQKLNIGVPQGSSLGNTMFLIFLNDMAHLKIKGDLIQYADDTTVIVSGDTMNKLYDNVTENMKILSRWFTMNGLKLNASKTSIIIFNAVSPIQQVVSIPTYDGDSLKSSNLVKLLGFNLDPALTWKDHVHSTCSKMAKGIYALKQLKPIASECYLKEVYYAYVHSIMAYGIILWGNSTDNERILKMQKRAIRVLVRVKFRESCREHFQNLGILTVASLYIYELLKYVRTNLETFDVRGENTSRSIRNKNVLVPIKHRLNLSKKMPKIIGTNLYNKLPKCIKSTKNYKAFCSKVKLLLLTKTIYSVKEYLTNDYRNFKLNIDD